MLATRALRSLLLLLDQKRGVLIGIPLGRRGRRKERLLLLPLLLQHTRVYASFKAARLERPGVWRHCPGGRTRELVVVVW